MVGLGVHLEIEVEHAPRVQRAHLVGVVRVRVRVRNRLRVRLRGAARPPLTLP